MSRPTLGVLGLGRMGLPITQALLAAGYSVVAFDPEPHRVADAVGAGAVAAADEVAVAAAAEVLITVLPGSTEVGEVLPAALAALPPGGVWLDLTSSDPELVTRLAGDIPTVGAPMAGGPAAAQERRLQFYVGGPPAAVARVAPVLAELGTSEVVGDDVGAGYTAKLLANLLWFGQAVAVTEALLLGQALGVPPATLRATLGRGAGGSVFIDEYLDRLLDGDYLESFGIDRCVEELEILVDLAARHDVPVPVSTAVTRLYRDALRRYGAVAGELLAARLLEERAGRTLRRE